TAFGAKLSAVDGVGQVLPPRPSPDGKVVDFPILLKYSPISNEALKVAGGPLRDAAHSAAPPGSTALVGGMSSILADVSDATDGGRCRGNPRRYIRRTDAQRPGVHAPTGLFGGDRHRDRGIRDGDVPYARADRPSRPPRLVARQDQPACRGQPPRVPA